MYLFMFCFSESIVKGSNLKLYDREFSITMGTYLKLSFGSVKQIICRGETDFQFHDFFGTVSTQYQKRSLP